jgi:hypothetical protein
MPQAAAGNVISSNEQVGADVIKTGNIKDGEIKNTDISATAAIDLTKVPNAAAKGANTDITSLGGLTTPLSVEQGGTERASLDANEILVGGGTGAIVSIPVGTAGHYLKSGGAGVDPSFQAGPTAKNLGDYAARNTATVYTEGVDGFVTCDVAAGASGTKTMYFYADANADPSTERSFITGLDNQKWHFCIPVKASYKWKIVVSSLTITNLYFVPHS